MAGPLPDILRLLTYEESNLDATATGFAQPIMWDYLAEGSITNLSLKGWITSAAGSHHADWDNYMRLHFDVFFFGFDPDHPMMLNMAHDRAKIKQLVAQRTPTILNRSEWREFSNIGTSV